MSHRGFPTLLGPIDPDPCIAQDLGARSPILLVCDHAGRQVPACLDSLGVPSSEYERHIAWDIGAGALTEALGKTLGATTFRQVYSRLVIDCNRAPGREDMFVTLADGAPVPGNLGLDPAAKSARMDAIFHPYHEAIATEIDTRLAQGRPPALVSVHSFTPAMQGDARPWHLGVLHDGASAASRAMLRLLAAEPGLVVGDNQPYAMDNVDYTIPRHAIARGLPYLELEVRQDLIFDAAGVARFADLLARVVPAAFGD